MVFRFLNMSIYPEAGVRNQDSKKVSNPKLNKNYIKRAYL